MLGAALTLNLWSYQPKVGEFENKSTVKEVLLSPSKKDIKDIVKIDQVLFTIEGTYYGTSSDEKIGFMMNEIGNWQFDDTFRKIYKCLCL